ncbi:hypothetical protein F5Y13DRAFT_190056 [Hypoxylon sp. FL1857]|nr:hypothetical protein F5Y13DRAFT_190056 [Hypoxylon sp. FL1857]
MAAEDEAGEFVIREFNERMTSAMSMVPQCTLDPDMEKYALGRGFFTTKKGYFGLARMGAAIGDKIAVIRGSEVPFILRSSEEASGDQTWKIIGEAYVHEIMEGQVMAEEAVGNAKSSTICIK